jgi:hypothetical protein
MVSRSARGGIGRGPACCGREAAKGSFASAAAVVAAVAAGDDDVVVAAAAEA